MDASFLFSAEENKQRQERQKSGCCVECGQKFNFHMSIQLGPEDGVQPPTAEEKRIPGMVYSTAGYLEVKISGMCEACFDKITLDF